MCLTDFTTVCLNSSRQHVRKYGFLASYMCFCACTPQRHDVCCLVTQDSLNVSRCVFVCVSFLFSGSLQSLFLIEFAPPAGAPGKERHYRKLTVSYLYLCQVVRKGLILSVCDLLNLISCFTFLAFAVGQVKFDPPLRKETEPHHEPVSSPPSSVCKTVWEEAEPHLKAGDTLNTIVIELCWTKHKTYPTMLIHVQIFSTNI